MSLPHILEIHIEEPTSDPAQPSIHHALADDLAVAEKRYRALIRVLISQLVGLTQTHVRFIITPADDDAINAVSYWMLPFFRGNVRKSESGNHFYYTPEQNAPSFTISFTSDKNLPLENHQKSANLSAHCPSCSARWINTAMMQCTELNHVVGENYLKIQHRQHLAHCNTLSLPELAMVHTDADWQLAMDSPIGPKLKKFYDEICRNL